MTRSDLLIWPTRLAAAALVAGSLAACTQYNRTATTGALIGGASGAAIGASVSDDEVEGALVGGALGAAGGAVVGRSLDRDEVVCEYDPVYRRDVCYRY
ncbi:glycine zipper domain-containing protein [Salinarimonas sp.]|uniref:glycine zipper domain-containing protein n=1 Tax=Salinarimonas sp. TaxID=2766526 RepID=UPI0032D8C312